MKLPERLERLARLVPGIAGYQDNERLRDRAAALRQRVVAELDTARQMIGALQTRLADRGMLDVLPGLDRLAARLDGLVNTVRYAARGYRAVFDTVKADTPQLAELESFDAAFAEQVAALRGVAGRLTDCVYDHEALQAAREALAQALDELERSYAARRAVLAPLEKRP